MAKKGLFIFSLIFSSLSGFVLTSCDDNPQIIQGPQGIQGEKGDTGATGPEGPQGPKGDKGDTGPAGEEGPKGDKGDTGPAGEVGPKGDKGDTGPTGPQGNNGSEGPQGIAGYSVLTGNGEPTVLTGKNGDSYIDLSTWDYYLKNDGVWNLSGNLKGEKGIDGNNGISIESAIINDDGDLIITLSNSEVINAGNLVSKKTHTVSFYCDDYLVATREVLHGDKVSKPTTQETAGYTISDWRILDEGEYKSWIFYGYVVTENMSLFADFTYNNYTVSFVDDKFGKVISNETVTYLHPYSFSEQSQVGYTHLGFYNNDVFYALSGTWFVHDNITLHLKWSANSYVVTLDPNGGSLESLTVNVSYDSEYILPAPTRLNYTFLGWFFEDNKISSNAIWKFAENKTLQAHWTNVTNTYVFDAGNGVCETNSIVIGWEDNYSLPFPTYEGHYFDGWYLDGTFIPQTGVWTYSNSGGMLVAKYYSSNVSQNYSFILNESTNMYAIQSTYKNFKNLEIPTYFNNKIVYAIDDNAFKECTNLTSVKLPKLLQEIGDYSFYNDTSLKTINFPESLKRIDNYAFRLCKSLESDVLLPNIEYLIYDCFSGCNKIRNVVIGGAIEEIQGGTFSGCSMLENIVLPQTIKYLGGNYSAGGGAFSNCTSLEKFPLLPNLKVINYGCFRNDSSLEEIYLPITMTHILENSFKNCTSLERIFYHGSKEEFDSIYVHANSCLDNSKVFYYSLNIPAEPGNFWHFVDDIPTPWQ